MNEALSIGVADTDRDRDSSRDSVPMDCVNDDVVDNERVTSSETLVEAD